MIECEDCIHAECDWEDFDEWSEDQERAARWIAFCFVVVILAIPTVLAFIL